MLVTDCAYVALLVFFCLFLFASTAFFLLGHLFASVRCLSEQLMHFLFVLLQSLHVCPSSAHSEHILYSFAFGH